MYEETNILQKYSDYVASIEYRQTLINRVEFTFTFNYQSKVNLRLIM
jgi:hypothetical protein